MGSDLIAADPHPSHLRLRCHGTGHGRGFDDTPISADRRQAEHEILHPYQMRAQVCRQQHMPFGIGPFIVDDGIPPWRKASATRRLVGLNIRPVCTQYRRNMRCSVVM